INPREYKSSVGNKPRKRLPNGFGQISKIKNRNLRNPYRVLVTVGKDSNGKPVVKPLYPQSYFHAYNEAYEALVEFHLKPGEISPYVTVLELYYYWSKEHYARLTSDAAIRGFQSAWKRCSRLYSICVSELTKEPLMECIRETASASIKAKIKVLFDLMLDYAIEKSVVSNNVARSFKLKELKN
ncbi:MAG: integrase, partial [Acutalibacter sp.]|nr:integrase [Acutalibacter sp.]